MGDRLITGSSHKTKTKKTALEHVQNGYNAIYARLALDSQSCHPVKTNYRVFTLRSLNLKYQTYNVLVLKTKLIFVKCYYMLCLLLRYLLFRFNMATSGARLPRILNHKVMLTSYLMAVSSNLIKKSLIQYIVWSYIAIPSRLIV